MPDTETLNHLLTVLRERRIPLTRDDVQWAFESVKTHDEAVAWVQEYLQPNTLLSKEEAELHEKLCRKNWKSKNRTEPSEAQPIQDDDLREAIEALETSTAAIDEQTKVLEVQMDALLELRTQNAEPDNGVRRKQEDRKRRNAQEKAQLDFTVEGLADATNERITSARKLSKAATATLSSTATDRLTSDDRKLAALTTLSPKLESNDDQSDPQNIDDWCNSLVSLRAAVISTRVDRIFQESLLKSDAEELPARSEEEALAEKEALKEELETLHAEISSVAQMGVEQELRGPILQTLEQRQGQQKRLQSRWLEYILSSLEYMAARLHALSMHASELHAHQTALGEINAHLAAALPPSPPQPTARHSPFKHASSRSPSRPKSATEPVVLSPGTQQLLCHLDITAPATSTTLPQARQALAQALLDHEKRLHDHYGASHKTCVQGIGEAVGGGDVEVQATLEALFANSEYRQTALGKRVLEERLQGLEKGIGEASACMPSMNERMEVMKGQKGERFVEKWARE